MPKVDMQSLSHATHCYMKKDANEKDHHFAERMRVANFDLGRDKGMKDKQSTYTISNNAELISKSIAEGEAKKLA
jgi:hypothetical protein